MKSIVSSCSMALVMLLGSHAALADGTSEDFIKGKHAQVEQLMRQPASPARDAKLTELIDTFVAHDEIARRSFGKPCPQALPQCTDWYDWFTEPQRAELSKLLKQLVEKNYRKTLKKTADYEISYKGSRSAAFGDEKVRTEAKSKANQRDPAIQVDYLVHAQNGKLFVVDTSSEGSLMTKNYYDQLNKMILEHGGRDKDKPGAREEAYDYVSKKLADKVARARD